MNDSPPPTPTQSPAQPTLADLLADGALHSGTELARRLGVSRTAVWKQVRDLRQRLGLAIVAEPSRGYRLEGWEPLDAERLRDALEPGVRGLVSDLHIFPSIDSTNSWLMMRARSGAPSGTLCLAEGQTGGRGRRGRRWVSPLGGNLYLSLLWRFALPPARLGALSLACGIGVLRALGRIGVDDAQIKWPNDLLWHGRKLAGLLLEVGGELEGPSFVVVGVGINVKASPTAGAEIDQPWCQLADIPEVSVRQRNQLAASVVGELAKALEEFGRAGLGAFLAEWKARDQLRGTQVGLDLGGRRVQGRYLGIAATGAIRLEVDGVCQEFQVGEVSIQRAEDPGPWIS